MPKRPNPARKRLKEIKRLITREDGTTYRKSFFGHTLEEAESKYQRFLEPDAFQKDIKSGTFGDIFFNHYMPLKTHLRANSIDDIQNTARKVLPELADFPCRQIIFTTLVHALNNIALTEAKTARFGKVPTKAGKLLSPRTVNKCRSLMLEVMGIASELDDKVKLINPRRIPRRKEKPSNMEVLTPAQFKRLLRAAEGRTCEAALLLYGGCGLRLNEGLGLFCSDLTAAGVLLVHRQAEESGETTEDLKTDDSRRQIPLSPAFLERLRPFAFGKPTERLVRGVNDQALMESNLAASINRAIRRAGLPPTTRHALRHFFSSWLEDNGCPPTIRMRLLGHSTKDIKYRYNHPTETAMREWQGKLWAAIEGAEIGEELPAVRRGGAAAPARGENNGRAVLDEDKVREIRRRAKKEIYADLAREFKVSQRAIRNIVHLKTWKHVS